MPTERTERTELLLVLDAATTALVRLSARITGGSEASVREGLAECRAAGASDVWVEELMLQSYLFAGFPRALNAAREWRRQTADGGGQKADGGVQKADAGGQTADGGGQTVDGASYDEVDEFRRRGEATCAKVYGTMYAKLRGNIRHLHPQLDEWMIVEGYGKVLSREGLDLPRRELCIVAACVAAQQDRQLHSHLHGALNAGVSPAAVTATLGALGALGALGELGGVVPAAALESATLLWARVRGK